MSSDTKLRETFLDATHIELSARIRLGGVQGDNLMAQKVLSIWNA